MRPRSQELGGIRDCAILVITSFIIQYLCWQARERLGDTCLKWRLFAQVDRRREMPPMAFVDPDAFPITYPFVHRATYSR
jgi:hypothetical protein